MKPILLVLLLQAQDPVDRLIQELKSPTALRREIALAALKAYGGTAVARLEAARSDPDLVDAVRGVTPDMRAARKKMETQKIDLTLNETPADDGIAFLRDFSGLNIIVDPRDRAPGGPFHDRTITIKVVDKPVEQALKTLLAATDKKLRVEIQDGPIVVVTSSPMVPLPRAPVRVVPAPENLRKLVEELGSDAVEDRDRAGAAIRALGFTAEPELWRALDSPGEAAARAADLLRALYSPPGAADERVRKIRITVDMSNAPLSAVLDYLREVTSLNFICDPVSIAEPEKHGVTIRFADVRLDRILDFLLEPLDLVWTPVEGQIYVARRGRAARVPSGPSWAAPDTAARIELLLSDLASEDGEKRELATRMFVEVGGPALGPLLEASRFLKDPVAARCREVCRRIAADKQTWLVDEASGADLQTLTPAQSALLRKELSLRLKDAWLFGFLKDFSIGAEFKAAKDLKVTLDANNIPLGSLLRIVLRPRGFDFLLDGQTVVVDTAENIRKKFGK